jgi:hypothetical protein
MRKFFSCFSSMWPIPANSRPVIESYATRNFSVAQRDLKNPVRVTSSPMTARRLRSLKDVVMDVTVTEAHFS